MCPHPAEEVAEAYCLGRLPEPEARAFEDHYLLCPDCARRLEQAEELVQVMRLALAAPA